MDAASEPSNTRSKVFKLLKEVGPASAESIASELGLTKMGALKHLHAGEKQGLVRSEDEAKPRGRPVKIWKLTSAADRIFPDAHADLAVSLIDQLKRTLGAQGLQALMDSRTKEQIEAYGRELEGIADTKERAERLAELRTNEGYMAVTEEGESGLMLVERHCPICSAARSCTGLCASEAQVFSALFPQKTVTRVEHMINGDTRCAYRIADSESVG